MHSSTIPDKKAFLFVFLNDIFVLHILESEIAALFIIKVDATSFSSFFHLNLGIKPPGKEVTCVFIELS